MASEALFEDLGEGFQIGANASNPKIEWLASQLVDGRPWSRDSGSIAVVSPTRSNISNEMVVTSEV